ncbi:MAG: STAS domain-containing protein [Pelagibaca sp.]
MSVPTYDLPTKATMSECAQVHASLRQMIEDHDAVVVTCGQVAQTDLAMLQLLISAQKTAARDAKSFSVLSQGNGTFDAQLEAFGICFSPKH